MKINLPACKNCQCLKNTLFQCCDNENLLRVSENKSSRIYKKNQILYTEGEKPTGVYCVHSGKIKIVKTNKEGKEQILRIIAEGEHIGYHALISNADYADNAIIIEDAIICHLPKNSFIELINTNRIFSQLLLQKLSVDLLEAESFIKHLAFKPVRERMADAFVLLKKAYRHTDSSELLITISRGDLANIIGTAKETTTRLLSEFKEENIISIEGKDIKIINWNKIFQISQLYE